MVSLKGAKRALTEVWTGSINISEGDIHGQPNVGHWVRDSDLAKQFRHNWSLLKEDPGALNSSTSKGKKENAEFARRVVEITLTVVAPTDIGAGVKPIFSPSRGAAALKLYDDLIDTASEAGFLPPCLRREQGLQGQLPMRSPR